jgi:CO/xanthine dehydrogenase Mo-binding subunit
MHRFSSTPLENNAVIAQWDDNDERLYFWSNNSFPTIGIQLLAPALHLRMDQVRVQTHDIGGSFGIKITNYPQMAVCALASRKANGAPIKWS